MPYDDGSRSLKDALLDCLRARKVSYDHARRAEFNRCAERSCPSEGSARLYATRAAKFETQELDAAMYADACSNDALNALMTGAYDERDIKRTV